MSTGPASRLMPTLRRVVLAGTVNDRTDGQLLGAFVANRDADAFAGLVRRHGPMVLGVCRRVIGDHTTADDAFQAVFLVLARRAAAIKPREQVGNWLYGVAYRTAIKARAVLARRRSREKQVDVMPEPPVNSPPDVWSDLQPVIDEELARLPDNLRLPIVLCDLEGRAQREVAKHLGVPLATLASRIATARRTLALRLTRRGVTLSGGALAGLLTSHGTVTAVSHSLAYGLAQAAETVAAGGIATSLVSAHAIQLSEGVIRMMLLTKLKTVAVALLTAVALTGGLGLGLVPAAAGDDPAQAPGEKPAVASPTNNPQANPGTKQTLDVAVNERNFDTKGMDDLTFLRWLTLDLRGTLPTDVEKWFFIADEDTDKRAKVVVWMSEDDAILAQLAKKFEVPAEKIRLLRVVTAKDGKPMTLVVIDAGTEQKVKPALVVRVDDQTGKVQNVRNRTWRTMVVMGGENDSFTVSGPGALRLPAPTGNYLKTVDVDAKGDGFFQYFHTAPNTNGLPNSGNAVFDFDGDGMPDLFISGNQEAILSELFVQLDNPASTDSDAAFLKRVILDVRGTAPTALEEKYFTEDKDPKKREKLLNTLLKDPAVAKKLGDEWKKKMLATPSTPALRESRLEWNFVEPKGLKWKLVAPNEIVPVPAKPKTPQQLEQPLQFELKFANPVNPPAPEKPKTPQQQGQPLQFELKFADPVNPPVPEKPKTLQQPSVRVVVPDGNTPTPATPRTPKTPQPSAQPQSSAPQPTRLEKLVSDLLAAKKSDAEMLEAVTLATVGRLPTDAEKRLTLGLVGKTVDRKAAWVEVAKALAATEEGTKRGGMEVHFAPKVIEFVVPAAKP